MAEHTKGPWHYTNRLIFEAGGICIAETFHRSPIETPCPEANARLMAAAPDLLEACKNVEEAWAGNGDMAVAVDACLLAINKAKSDK